MTRLEITLDKLTYSELLARSAEDGIDIMDAAVAFDLITQLSDPRYNYHLRGTTEHVKSGLRLLKSLGVVRRRRN